MSDGRRPRSGIKWSQGIEDAFRSSAPDGASLTEHLRSVALAARALRPEYMGLVDAFTGRLAAIKAGGSAPKPGEAMPDFLLPDQDDRLVGLTQLTASGPAVVAILRGHWCPFCRLNIIGLAEVKRRAPEVPLVVITPELQPFGRLLRKEAGADIPILSDAGLGFILSLGLAVALDERLAQLIERAGWDVPLYQGGTGWLLPIPSVFVIGADGTVIDRHIDPDYRQRMEVGDLLAAIECARAVAPRSESL